MKLYPHCIEFFLNQEKDHAFLSRIGYITENIEKNEAVFLLQSLEISLK